MSEQPPRERNARQNQADQHREEAALPVPVQSKDAAASTGAAVAMKDALTVDWPAKRRTTLRVVGVTVLLSVVMSGLLEYEGWQLVYRDMPAPHAPIPPLSFLRGMWDTTLGAVGIGAASALATLIFPSTWKKSWRRVPAAFALGAAAFIGFLHFVTFGIIR